MIAPPMPTTTPMIVFFELDERPEDPELLLFWLLRLAALDDVEDAEAAVAATLVVCLAVEV